MQIRITLFLLLIISFSSFSQYDCYDLVWSDEFDGTALNQNNWNYDLGDGCPNLCGWGNNELQSYTSNTNNVRVANGILTIEARREGNRYTSGKILTKNKHAWTYGRFEARMRMPKGRGAWPAFWMLRPVTNWPMTGEIDIMEYRGDQPNLIHGTLHYGNTFPNNQFDGNVLNGGTDFSTNYHLYAVEWDENSIKWYVDNNLFKTETRDPNTLNPQSGTDPWPWNTDFYLILNLAVGGWFTGTTDINDVNLSKPTLEVDYVRIYKQKLSTAREAFNKIASTVPGKIEVEHYDVACDGSAYFDTDEGNTGGTFRTGNVDIEETIDNGGGHNIGWTEDGEWLEYTMNASETGSYSIDVRAASENNGGIVSFSVDGQEVISTMNINSTDGWQIWETTTSPEFFLSEGEHVLRMTIETGGFNLNYIDLKTSALGTNDLLLSNGIYVFPNPVQDYLSINLEEGGFNKVEVLNLLGEFQKYYHLNPQENKLDLSKLRSGSYILKLHHENGRVITTPIQKI